MDSDQSKAEKGFTIQISFRTQDPNIDRLDLESALIHDPPCFQNPRIHSIYREIHNPCAF